MRIRTLKAVWLASVLLVLAGSGTALAQREGPYLSGDVGASLVQDVDGVFDGVPGTLKLNPGVRFGLAAGYTLASQPTYEAAVQFETGFLYNEAKKVGMDTGEFSLDGDFYQVPVLADIIYTFRCGPRLVPYIGVGGGGVYHKLDIDSLEGLSVNQSEDGFDPAFQGMAGLRFKLTELSEIGLGYKYLATFADSTVQAHSVSLMYLLRF